MKTKNRIKRGISFIASQLPLSIEIVNSYKIVDGSDILDGTVTIDLDDGQVIESHKKYKVKEKQVRYINHKRRLKKSYKDKGDPGIDEYIAWVKRHNSEMAKEHPQLFKKRKQNEEEE